MCEEEEEYFEVEDIENKINEEFKLGVKKEYFLEHIDKFDLESMLDEEKYL